MNEILEKRYVGSATVAFGTLATKSYLYVEKATWEAMGRPERLTVTVEPADDLDAFIADQGPEFQAALAKHEAAHLEPPAGLVQPDSRDHLRDALQGFGFQIPEEP